MAHNTPIKTLLLTAFVLLIGCSCPASALDEITPIQATAMVNTEHAVIIDVREQDEYNAGHIAGAVHIPLGQVTSRLAEITVYKGRPIVMQCRSGRRSATAANILLKAGFENVFNLSGGIIAWEKSGLPLEK